jgi:hypothetical protein
MLSPSAEILSKDFAVIKINFVIFPDQIGRRLEFLSWSGVGYQRTELRKQDGFRLQERNRKSSTFEWSLEEDD